MSLIASPATGPAFEQGSAEWHEAARRARRLSWLSLGWMAVEGAVGLAAGIFAGSIALLLNDRTSDMGAHENSSRSRENFFSVVRKFW